MDWLDPSIWKRIAEVAGHWQTIAVAAGAISAAILGALRWGFAPISWLISKISAGRKHREDRPLRFVLNERQSFCAECKQGEERGTQIVGMWDVTNIEDHDFVLLQGRVEHHFSRQTVLITLDPSGNTQMFSSRNPIRAGSMSEVSATFLIYPPIHKPGKPLVLDVTFTDNYGDEHRLRKVRFRPTGT
jgi:hypothetical protein